jgi:hypothetical protein
MLAMDLSEEHMHHPEGLVGDAQGKKLAIIMGVIVVCLLVVAAFFVARVMDEREREAIEMAPVNEQITDVRQIILALRTYAADYDDAFPDDLAVLISEGYLDDPDLLKTDFTLSRDREPYLYRPGYSATDHYHTPLIISPPSPRTGRRVVGYVNGSAGETELSEKEVEDLLAEDPKAAP